MPLRLVATAAFGLEAVVARELEQLGYEARGDRPGRVLFEGPESAVCRSNLWLRSADRVLIELARFPAADFDALFDGVKELEWEAWISPEAAVPVRGRSRKSQLSSVPAVQRTVKKAIVERLLSKHGVAELPETGPAVPVEVALLDDEATLSVDTSGEGLHKRGYRSLTGPAQIRETLAAAMVQLSFWQPGRPLLDPFCGTGTIAIEAAMLGRRLAPGRNRSFAAESWDAIPAKLWAAAREEASDLAVASLDERIVGTDADTESLKLARYHAKQAGVEEDLHLQRRDFGDLSTQRDYGCVVTNPPYGMRVGEEREVDELYRSLPLVLRRLKTWSHFVLTARDDLERLAGQRADRRRKLYNGNIKCTLYQFFGPKPPDVVVRGAEDEEDSDGVENQSKPPKKRERAEVKPAFGGLKAEAERQAQEFANRLKKRARHLRRWPTRRGITCYRLYERDIPEVPLVVDRYEDALHLAEFERPHDRTAAEHADWLDQMVAVAAEALETPPDRVFLKRRERQRGNTQYQQQDERSERTVVEEGGLKFLVNLTDYLDTGLFLDHRQTRAMVQGETDGKRFLNLFCYTGAFTVYAAAGGATNTVSVDLSSTYLDWAEENIRLNGFDNARHQLVESDVLQFIEGLEPKSQFDLAVIDPPTFSNSKQLDRDWDVQRDHARLLSEVAARLSPGGVIYFSTNFRRFKLDEASLTGLTLREISRQTVPEDFRNKRIHRCWRMVIGA